MPTPGDGTLAWVDEPHQQTDERGLPRSGRAYDAHGGLRFDVDADAVENGLPARVSKGHVLQAQRGRTRLLAGGGHVTVHQTVWRFDEVEDSSG